MTRPDLRRFAHLVLVVLTFAALAASGAGAQSLYFDPSHAFPQDLIFTVDLHIACGGLAVKGVETALTFDPALLRLDDVTPGPWFTGAGQDFFFFDYTDLEAQGNIHVASSILDGTRDQDGVFAVLHFSSRTFGTTPLTFTDVDVRGVDNANLGFVSSTGDSITIDPVVRIEPRPFGFLKAIYR
jgi:hypothetical protein